ncbi:MAG: alpha-ketoglutarate-dependent dioxygenase AlkB family protein [Pseudomonadota bacterium]
MDFEDLTLVDGRLRLWRGFLAANAADDYFNALGREAAWEQSVIRIYGRECPIPRLNAWHGDPGAAYTYSGRCFQPHPWTPALLEVKQRIESLTDAAFNSVLVNLYRDGNDSVSWHSDDEPELGQNPVIASVSLGAERKFVLKHKRRRDLPPVNLWLPTGSLLLMSGETQHHWTHQVPKTRKSVGQRINLTYRLVRHMATRAAS